MGHTYSVALVTSHGTRFNMDGVTEMTLERVQEAKIRNQMYMGTGDDGQTVIIDMSMVAFIQVVRN